MAEDSTTNDVVRANRTSILRKRRMQREDNSAVKKALAFGAVGLVLWVGYRTVSSDSGIAETRTGLVTCQATDAQCLGRKALIQASDTCIARIESQLSFQPEWDNGMLQPRLSTQGWYQPGQTLIHDGNHLIAQNGFGARKRVRYFCVTTVAGAYVKSGIVE